MQIEIREKAAKVLKLYKYGMRNIIFPYINNILKKLTNIDNDKESVIHKLYNFVTEYRKEHCDYAWNILEQENFF